MRRHREGNAVAADLWRALEEAAGARGRPRRAGLDRAARLPARRAPPPGQARRSRVTQERFFADPRVPRREATRTLARAARRQVGRSQAARSSTGTSSTSGAALASAAAAHASWVLRQRRRRRLLPHAPRRRRPRGTARRSRPRAHRRRTAGARRRSVGARARRAGADRRASSTSPTRSATRPTTTCSTASRARSSLIDDQVVEAERARRSAASARGSAGASDRQFAELGWGSKTGEDDAEQLLRASLLRIVGLLAETPAVRRGSAAGISTRTSPIGARSIRTSPIPW